MSFLKFLVPQLDLHRRTTVEILAERAETCSQQQEHIGAYDWVFTRYVATLRDSAVYCLPLLKPTGKWVAYKSGEETIKTEIDESVAYLRTLGGTIETVLQNPKFDRSYIVMHHIKP